MQDKPQQAPSAGPPVSLNLNVRGLPQSATLRINALSRQLAAEGRTVYRFGLGQSPFPVPESVVEALRQHADCKDYLPVYGLQALREAVAHYHTTVDAVPTVAEDILVGPGSKELMFLVQLAFYGDLIVPTPCWVSYAPQARIIGRQVRLVETSYEQGWRLQPEQLERLCQSDPGRPRLLVLNYPGNPDGDSYTAEQLQQIALIARRHQIVLLSDEIYGPLYHGEPHISVARFYPEGTVISSGLSKWCGAGGWRLGTFAFPPQLRWLRDAMGSLASETFTSTAAPIQWAAITAFALDPSIVEYLEQVRRILSALGLHVATALREAGARVRDPKGAFYLFPDFEPLRVALKKRGIETGHQLCDRALEEAGVAFLPGAEFGTPRSQLTARLAYVDFDGRRAIEAAQTLPGKLDEAFLRSYCEPVVEGIEALCRWLRKV